jgi:hypothetical protein
MLRAPVVPAIEHLEQVCREAWEKFPDHVARTVAFPERRNVSGLYSDGQRGTGFFIHCGRYVDQQAVGTISNIPAKNALIGELRPGNDKNFLNSDFLALLQGNHVICLGCGRNAGSLRNFLIKLFEKAGIPPEKQIFELSRVSNTAAIKRISRDGVRKIDVDVAISTLNATKVSRTDRGVWHFFKLGGKKLVDTIVGYDQSYEQIKEISEAHLSISIDLKKGELAAGKKSFGKVAKDIIQDDEADNYKIHLNDGNTISLDDISLKTWVTLDEVANSVSVHQAWDKMSEYISQLRVEKQISE